MSIANNVLIITPPLFFFDGSGSTDRKVIEGFKCPTCSGNGWNWDNKIIHERVKKDCLHCNGTGEIVAVVTVEWKAGNKKHNHDE